MTDEAVENEWNVNKERVHEMVKNLTDNRKKEHEKQMGHTTIGQIEGKKKDVDDLFDILVGLRST